MTIFAADTVTKLPPGAEGVVIVTGSHGGRYPGALVAKARARAAIFNDAGIGRDEAGIGGLALLEGLGIAAAAVSHLSCRIGEAADMMERGIVSRANGRAQSLGVRAGTPCREAAAFLENAIHVVAEPPDLGEARVEIAGPNRRILLLDSAALVGSDDSGHIVVTGSHGGLVGGDPAAALRTEGFAAIFNDAGIGADGAGLARLAALDGRGVAAFTVSAASARIGEGRSSFEDGVISAANRTAQKLGAASGLQARGVILKWAGY